MENQRIIVERLDRIMEVLAGGDIVPLAQDKEEAQNPDGAKK